MIYYSLKMAHATKSHFTDLKQYIPNASPARKSMQFFKERARATEPVCDGNEQETSNLQTI